MLLPKLLPLLLLFGCASDANYKAAKRYDIEPLRARAEQGDAEAQYNLGDSYDWGKGVPRDDVEAAKWYRKAAEQGDAKSQSMLGKCYAKGDGVAQNYSEAVRWYRKAAAQGFAQGQFNLGWCYDNGEGVPRNTTEALKWYRKAALQGHYGAKQCGAAIEYMQKQRKTAW
jgi:TPR repeat protein